MPQSLANILTHIIFSTKNRAAMIRPAGDELHRYLASICNAHGCPAFEVGGAEDHVHIVCSLSRTLALSDLLKQIKASSSKWMKTKVSQFSWQGGYGAFSIGQSQLESVRQYIRKQEEHHAKMSFQEEFREFLKKYGVEYDERYVWD